MGLSHQAHRSCSKCPDSCCLGADLREVLPTACQLCGVTLCGLRVMKHGSPTTSAAQLLCMHRCKLDLPSCQRHNAVRLSSTKGWKGSLSAQKATSGPAVQSNGNLLSLQQQRIGKVGACHKRHTPVRTEASKDPPSASSSALPEVRDARNAPPSGPRGMLLIGFSEEYGEIVRKWMEQMEPGFPVSHCTAAMLDGSVQQAVRGSLLQDFTREQYEHVDEVLPRLVLLSGMSGEEAVAIAQHWEEFTGTPPPIFAMLVEKLLHKPVRKAVYDICKAHVSRESSNALVDTAALRQMIRQKMEEKQRGGARLISRDGAQHGSKTAHQPIIDDSEALHQSQGSKLWGSPVSGFSHAPYKFGSIETQQNKVQAAYAKKLLQAITPPKAQTGEKEKRKRPSKEKVVRKGFG